MNGTVQLSYSREPVRTMALDMTAVDPTPIKSDAPPDGGAGELSPDVFKMIVDLSANPFVGIRPDGHICCAGASVERLLGWTPQEIAGKNIVEFLPADQIELAIE